MHYSSSLTWIRPSPEVTEDVNDDNETDVSSIQEEAGEYNLTNHNRKVNVVRVAVNEIGFDDVFKCGNDMMVKTI